MTSVATSATSVAPQSVEDSPSGSSIRSDIRYPMMLPYSVKVYPIIQTAPEIEAPARGQWLPDAQTPHRAHSRRDGKNQLYLHVPFCPFLCSFCPLYKEGSKWIQKREAPIANPYLGKSVPPCGSFVD